MVLVSPDSGGAAAARRPAPTTPSGVIPLKPGAARNLMSMLTPVTTQPSPARREVPIAFPSRGGPGSLPLERCTSSDKLIPGKPAPQPTAASLLRTVPVLGLLSADAGAARPLGSSARRTTVCLRCGFSNLGSRNSLCAACQHAMGVT